MNAEVVSSGSIRRRLTLQLVAGDIQLMAPASATS